MTLGSRSLRNAVLPVLMLGAAGFLFSTSVASAQDKPKHTLKEIMENGHKGDTALIRKAAIGVLIIALFAAVDGVIGMRLPTSFLPEEDYGYAFLNVQLPAPAALERTDQVLKKVEGILEKTGRAVGSALRKELGANA